MSSSPSKKRKANDDGRATDVSTNNNNDLSQKMDRMMQIMMGMQEKLISVESRCKQLEVKCNSLENKLTAKMDKTIKHQEYNDMLLRNQNWNYSAPIHSIEYWMDGGYDSEEAEYLLQTSEYLKYLTKTIRRGEFTIEEEKGIDFGLDADGPIFDWNVNVDYFRTGRSLLRP